MNRMDVIFLCIILSIIILLAFGFYQQMQQQKLKIMCNGELRKIGSALFIHTQNQEFSNSELSSWRDILAKYSPGDNFGYCPTQKKTETFTYKINTNANLKDFNNKNQILFFDAVENLQPTSSNLELDIDERHLSQANILLSDGSIQSIKKASIKK